MTKQIEAVTGWITQNVCQKLELLTPGGEKSGEKYQYKRVKPVCFPLYVPTKDKLPPAVSSLYPSYCVQPTGGELTNDKQTLELIVSAAAWNKGIYKKGKWTQNADGWKDAWLMIDVLLDELQSTDEVGGLAIDRSQSIKFGGYKENESEALADFYPYFFGWVSFQLYTHRLTPKKSYENYL